MVHPTIRLLPAVAAFAVAGWIGGAIITASGGLSGMAGTIISIEAARAGGLAALLAAALGAPVLLLRSRPLAIVGWLLVSLVGTGLATWAYYLIWPPQWEAPAYKIAGMVLKGYWKQLTPLALLTGALCGWLTTRPAVVSSEEETG